MDFKFFNTYGPSKYFTWDGISDDTYANALERVNISLFFRLRLKPNYDANIITNIMDDIKEFVEDINTVEMDIHMPNLTTLIETKYKDSIVFFEFVSINGNPVDYQHIYAMHVPDGLIVPEFVCIDTYTNEDTGETGLPDITIELV